MNWKNTVLKHNQIQDFALESVDHDGYSLELLEKQAAITGDIAFKAGMQKVVDWVRTHPNNPFSVPSWESRFEAKLKEWGVK